MNRARSEACTRAGVLTLSDIIHWEEITTGTIKSIWHPYILSGAVNLLQGDSTAGKSYLSQALIAALTTGRALPGANPMPPVM